MQVEWRFRPLLELDFERLWRWLNEPHVNRWWSRRPVTRDEVRVKYLPRVRGEVPTQCLIALLEGKAAGYVQTFRIEDLASATQGFVLPLGGWGLDWFIGEPGVLGHGHGARLLASFVRTWLWARADARYAAAGSSVDNVAALKSYERAHFVPWFSTLPRSAAERYYRCDRQDGGGWSKKKT